MWQGDSLSKDPSKVRRQDRVFRLEGSALQVGQPLHGSGQVAADGGHQPGQLLCTPVSLHTHTHTHTALSDTAVDTLLYSTGRGSKQGCKWGWSALGGLAGRGASGKET